MTILRHLNLNKKFVELQKEIIANDGVECEQVPDIYFPDFASQTRQSNQEIALAKQICKRCIVIDLCLDYALADNIQYGIWGGLTPDERRTLTRKR